MKISGFSYIRNGFEFDYPFIESIQSILPICDEFVIAVGDSKDGTREAIEKLNSPKIKIIDTVWDENLRKNGKIFAQQANIALDHITGDWGFHIQADEVIHEKDLELIKEAVNQFHEDKTVEGILFHFMNFWGSYKYIRTTRKAHRFEVRIIRNIPGMRSYRDSQGFRKYSDKNAIDTEAGKKLKVKKIKVSIFHYNYVRPPELMKQKSDYFHRFWHNDQWLKENTEGESIFQFEEIDDLDIFRGSHPALMKSRVDAQNWEFEFDKKNTKFSLKDRWLHQIEMRTGWRIGEYRNYKLLR
jgi:hypothetical protein